MDETELSIRDVALTRDLLRSGMEKADLAKLRRVGAIDHVRRGAYAGPDTKLAPAEQHRRLILATMPLMSPRAVVSHTSAAMLHGLPILDRDLGRVHVTSPRERGQGRIGRYVHVHGAQLDPAEAMIIDGVPVTSPARTVVDSARILKLGPALAVADAGVRRGVTREELTAVLEQHQRRRGIPTARFAVALADARSESPGESFSRAVLVQQQLPIPDLQREIFDDDGHFVGRVDFCWEEHRTLAEFDGEIKYGRALKSGQSIEEVVYREKLREDALRDLGWQVVRWIWRDLYRPWVIVDRLERAFARAARG